MNKLLKYKFDEDYCYSWHLRSAQLDKNMKQGVYDCWEEAVVVSDDDKSIDVDFYSLMCFEI